MFKIEHTNQFKKDLKLAKRRGKNLCLLSSIIYNIEHEICLDLKWRDHVLTGEWKSHRELHVENDWLLIYKLIPNDKTVIFVRTGSHADLFG